jgi:AraC-like DNA-binding protein
MSRALSVRHGSFGRASLYELDRAFVRHVHREAHLLFFLGGALSEIVIGNRPFLTDQALAVAVNPWEPHGFAPVRRDGSGHFLIFYFNPDWMRSLKLTPAASGPLFAAPTVRLTPRLRAIRDDICQMLVDGICDPAVFETLLIDLVTAVEDSAPRRQLDGPQLDGRQTCAGNWSGIDFRLRKSFAALAPGLPAAANLSSVARSSGLSRAHFFKLFREQLGLTPSVYVNALRIETALEQIARKEASITTISDELGFSCQSAFTRFFSAHVGMSPTDYRRAVQVMHSPAVA